MSAIFELSSTEGNRTSDAWISLQDIHQTIFYRINSSKQLKAYDKSYSFQYQAIYTQVFRNSTTDDLILHMISKQLLQIPAETSTHCKNIIGFVVIIVQNACHVKIIFYRLIKSTLIATINVIA